MIGLAIALTVVAAAAPAGTISPRPAPPSAGAFPILELRQYTLHDGKRDTLIDLFEREFIEPQEVLGMKVIGTFRDLDRPMLAQGYDFRPLRIGDDVMVSAKCTVIADLGDRAFVAANSVVTQPVPAFCLAAGVPATIRDYFGPPGGEPDELVAAAP